MPARDLRRQGTNCSVCSVASVGSLGPEWTLLDDASLTISSPSKVELRKLRTEGKFDDSARGRRVGAKSKTKSETNKFSVMTGSESSPVKGSSLWNFW